MAATSTMLALGTPLPEFSLPDTVTGATVSSASLLGSISVVVFACNHCPYVRHIQAPLAAFGAFCAERSVKVVAISSNDVAAYPEDGPGEMAAEARRAGYGFPYLYDETQAVALAFRAACTPEIYVFDRDGRLAYRGRFDDSTPKNGRPATGAEARAAVIALLEGRRPPEEQQASIGCSIKWKPGVAPGY